MTIPRLLTAILACAALFGVGATGIQAGPLAGLGSVAPNPGRDVVPIRRVRCADYTSFVQPYARGFEQGPDRGQYGPRHALPALAVFARTGEPRLAAGIKQTLRHYGDWIDGQIAARGGVQSMEGATLLAIHFRELRARGQASRADEAWLRDTVLKLRRHSYGLKPGDGPWRGSQHRGAVDTTNNLLAGTLYPNEPQAARWRAAGERGWRDWWDFRDIGINDTAYFSDSLAIVLRTADLLERDEVFSDARARATLWDRLVFETSPDGALIPYGWHAGWNGLAGVRIWALELAARATGDGRYRYVATRLMNYATARGGFSPGQEHWQAISVESVALAAIACDDRIAPVQPQARSRVLERPEIVRLSLDQVRARYPDAGDLDARMAMTSRQMPGKLVLRSGWSPGDMFMLVEAYPRHDPLNPTAILGFERWGSSFAEMISEKDVSRENAVRIEDLSGRAQMVGTATGQAGGRLRLPIGYDRMESTARVLVDDPLASHAVIDVTNYLGFRARQTREFLFIKNRFVLVRDETGFDDTFAARVGPVWNTQNVAARRGAHWADTWFSGHWYNATVRLYDNPPASLLLWYAPRDGATLRETPPDLAGYPPESQQAVMRHVTTTQYAWEGTVRPGIRLQFIGVLLPHAPTRDASGLAQSIRVLRDEPGLAAVALGGPGAWELAILNPDGRRLTFDSPGGPIVTDARSLYLGLGEASPRWSAGSATVLEVGGTSLHKSAARQDASTER